MCARTFYRHLHSCFDPLSLLIQRIIAKECPFGRTTKSSHVRIELAQTMLKMYFSIFYSKPSTFASQITRQSDNLQSPFKKRLETMHCRFSDLNNKKYIKNYIVKEFYYFNESPQLYCVKKSWKTKTMTTYSTYMYNTYTTYLYTYTILIMCNVSCVCVQKINFFFENSE